ncbi:MAG: hypothetical protein C6I00_07290 [Nitratiruptor sp.]|nr:hypothetical protein [Nitratiruptor sp.]NPA83839.1 TlpA family protein disulfide reductase [Campylobacterota bacterium]
MVRWLLTLLSLTLFLVAGEKAIQQQEGPVRQFEVVSVDGEKFHFEVSNRGVVCKECQGKVLIMDFFGKHCPPCRASIPILSKLQKEMGDKVQIISFHVQESLTPQDLVYLRGRLGLDYPIIDMTGSEANYQFVEYIGQASGWRSTIPYMLFFAPDGRYVGHHYGMVDLQSLKESVQKIMALQSK